MNARLILTDSGGLQEESTVLGVPCITLRHNTERPITCTQGTNRLVGNSRDRILEAAGQALDGEWVSGRVPELWDGQAAERVIRVLMDSPLPGRT
jgi:UDP-N-acetylglucosamine 2-epimerase (non-hydrolysing)